MSLGKLLTTGKSLVGLSHSNSRYQMQKGALPKFESAKNPFARSNAELSEQESQLPKLAPAEDVVANVEKAPLLPPPDEQKNLTVGSDSKPAAPVKPSPATQSWLKKLNPMVWFSKEKPAAAPKSAIPRFSKSSAPVQGELSLDNIKVMRNDLSDTDMEVVPMKSRPAKVIAPTVQASAAAMAIPDLPPATRAWEFLGEHLLGKE